MEKKMQKKKKRSTMKWNLKKIEKNQVKKKWRIMIKRKVADVFFYFIFFFSEKKYNLESKPEKDEKKEDG